MNIPRLFVFMVSLLFVSSCILVVSPEGVDTADMEDLENLTNAQPAKQVSKAEAAATAPKDEKTPASDTSPANGKAKETAKPEEPSSAAKKEDAAKDKKDTAKKDEKPYDEVIKDHDKIAGLFDIYKNDEHLYFSIKPEQIGEKFLVFQTLSKGIGEKFLIGGLPLTEAVIRFEKRGDKIDILALNTRVTAPEGSPTAKSLEHAFSDSLLATAKIQSTHPETKAILIDMQPVLLSDLPGLEEWLQEVMEGGYSAVKEASYFNDVRNFAKNIEINAILNYRAGKAKSGTETAPDARFLRLGVQTSIAHLAKDDNYMPRLADPRVGYFLDVRKDFDPKRLDDSNGFDRFIIRWQLEKADPSLALSPPKKPITFYVENTTPYEYRDMVKGGILAWNKAFEAAGFKDAVQAVIMPEDADWDPADMRYNTIRWINSSSGGFAGIGPARTNPYTGQILDADVLIEGEAIRGIHRYFSNYVAPVTTSSFELIPNSRFGLQGMCNFAEGRLLDANMAMIAMTTRGEITSGQPAPEEFIRGYILDLVAHEVGHVLGLRHNFKASTTIPTNQLHNKELTQQENLVGSVMDYNGINIAPPGVEQGDYFPVGVGPYDTWAIEYGYTPIADAKTPREEIPALEKIASRSADYKLAYATDEDTYGISLLSPDPRNMTWDLGNDPLEFAKNQMALSKEQFAKFPTVVREGDSFSKMRSVLSSLIFYYSRSAITACKYIGGIYMERNHKGDPSAKDPLIPVAAAKQREALGVLRDSVFNVNDLRFEGDLLRKLPPTRWWHWGTGSLWGAEIDFSLTDRVLNLQQAVLGWLFNGQVLKRIVDSEFKFQANEEPFTLPELFESIEDSVWNNNVKAVEAANRRKSVETVDTFRRALQREHVKVLVDLLHDGNETVPEDARTQAWASLTRILGKIDAVDGNPLHGYTEAHLRETKARIQKALDAHVQMPAY